MSGEYHGTLIPEHYEQAPPTQGEIELSSIIWGLSLGISVYSGFSAAKHTAQAWKRKKTVTSFMILIWISWLGSTIMGIVSWAFLKGSIQPSLEYFLVILFTWCLQVHGLMQVIINRIAILSIGDKLHFRLKWGVFATILAINISVACIWVPASLQINETYISINYVWDRIEKALICVIDLLLNLYFIHLVRSRLIANGLSKYNRLFHYNLGMIFVSVALDVLIVAMMSLPNHFVYVQFHPIVYLLKLQIEMGMADLIVKIVKATNPSSHGPYQRSTSNTGGQQTGSGQQRTKTFPWGGTRQQTTMVGRGDEEEAIEMEMEMYGKGIKKTVVTEVVTEEDRTNSRTDVIDDGRRPSETSSTAQLKKDPFSESL